MSDFNQQIIADFRANGGYVGPPFNSDKLVLLHHVGAKSGETRVSPLMSFPDDEGWVIVASKGGAPTNPAWYYNLTTAGRGHAEIGTEEFDVTVTGVVDGRVDCNGPTIRHLEFLHIAHIDRQAVTVEHYGIISMTPPPLGPVTLPQQAVRYLTALRGSFG